MIVECPGCKARYRLEEKHFGGRPNLQVRCTKCQSRFQVAAPATTPTAIPPSPSAKPMQAATVVSKVGAGLRMPEGKTIAVSVTQGQLTGKIFYLTKPKVVIGRLGADIVVDDPEVSRKHCALELHGSSALLVDLGSANGTFVDGQRIQTRELEHLSEFRLGATTLMFTVTKKEKLND